MLMPDLQITIEYMPDPVRGFTARVVGVPGAISEGETRDKARDNVLDALREILNYRLDAEKQSGPSAERETLSISVD